ncbi:hypothetical protein Ddye_024733 [Dipteronia dyeriana]|uniref:BED-type domain-containing protein n=1 Tax=Dipteronia dyeriana TaxID=168575 RepID=A0AAD9TWE6_9ROSI|nr:hypothetical protein Ddye_024733 [Dipteronia dyeriana]
MAVNRPHVEVLASPVTKRRKLVSKVWEAFTTNKSMDGKEWANCKHCSKKYARSSKKETSNLLKHMEKCPSRKNDEDQEKHSDETTATITTPVVNDNKIASDKEWNQLDDKIATDKEWNRLDVARMIIRHRCPWSMVEQDISKPFLNTLLPTSTFQSQSTLKADILHVYKEEKEKFSRSLTEISGRFSLTINFLGRDAAFRSICLIILHFIDNDWQPKKKILAFKKLGFWDGYWNKSRAFKSMLLDWNIDKNICCITAQNMEEEDNIVREIRKWPTYKDSVSTLRVLDCGCFVHFLNLLVEEGLLEVKDIFQKILMCNSYIFSTPDNDRKFRIAVDHARSQGKEVISEEVPVSSTYSTQMLDKALRFREAFRLLQVIDPDFSLNPLEEEWEKITRVHNCLKVLAEVGHSISGSRGLLTTNVFFPKVCSIYKNLIQWGKSDSSSDIRLMAYKLKMKLEVYWSKCHLVLAIAVILDPRFKFDIVESWYKEIYGQDADKHRKRIQDILKVVYDEYAGGFKNSTTSSADASTLFPDYVMLDHLGMSLTPSHGSDSDSGKSQKSQLERYLEEPKFRSVEEFDILGWWCVNTPNFPTLANMARDFLAIPVTAALANPTFISDVLKIDPISSDLDSEIMEALICLPDWLQIPPKTEANERGSTVSAQVGQLIPHSANQHSRMALRFSGPIQTIENEFLRP